MRESLHIQDLLPNRGMVGEALENQNLLGDSKDLVLARILHSPNSAVLCGIFLHCVRDSYLLLFESADQTDNNL